MKFSAIFSSPSKTAEPPRLLPSPGASSVSSLILSISVQLMSTVWEQRRRRRQREGQKSNRIRSAKRQLCTCITLFLYISLPSLHDYDVKMLNFTFCGECERKTTTFFFFLNFDTAVFKNSTPEKIADI